MARGRTPIWLSWTALAVYVFFAFVPVHGFVVCIGEDGHVALEAASVRASCFDCPNENPSAVSCCSTATTESTSCTCSDIPLSVGKSQATRVIAVGLLDLPQPAFLGVDPTLHEATLGSRRLDLHARSALPASPRVTTNLILRV